MHRAAWPSPADVLAPVRGAHHGALDVASGAIAAIRGAKSGARVSMRAPVRSLVVAARRDHLDAMRAILPDIAAAGRVENTELRLQDRAEPEYRVTL